MTSTFKKVSYLILILGGTFVLLNLLNSGTKKVLIPVRTTDLLQINKSISLRTQSSYSKLLTTVTTTSTTKREQTITQKSTSTQAQKISQAIPSDQPPGGPSVNPNKILPTKIPHIFHQTWDSYKVPRKFVPWIRSFLDKHPDWEYWFWTPEAVRLLLQKAYPDFISTYNSYDKNVFRANSMRYFIMYYFGGVYADLDLEFLKNIDPWTAEYHCFASEDAHVHAFIVNDMPRSNMMITVLGCRPNHPYFKAAIEKLPAYTELKYIDKLVFADTVYLSYNSTDTAHETPSNSIDLVHPDYLMGTYDSGWVGKVKSMCSMKKLPFYSKNRKKTCLDIMSRKFSNTPKTFAYANHHWVHVIMKPEYYKSNTVSIFEVFPNAKNVTKMIEDGTIGTIKPFH